MIKEILIIYLCIGFLLYLYSAYKIPMIKSNKIMVAFIIGWPFVSIGLIAGKLYKKKMIGDITEDLNEVIIDPENMPTDEMNEMMKQLQEDNNE